MKTKTILQAAQAWQAGQAGQGRHDKQGDQSKTQNHGKAIAKTKIFSETIKKHDENHQTTQKRQSPQQDEGRPVAHISTTDFHVVEGVVFLVLLVFVMFFGGL